MPAFRPEQTASARFSVIRISYRTPSKIEIMFGRLKDWLRVAMPYDRSAQTFFSAICIAATVIFWLCSMSREPRTVSSPWLRKYCNQRGVIGFRVSCNIGEAEHFIAN